MLAKIVRGLSDERCKHCKVYIAIKDLPNALCTRCENGNSQERVLVSRVVVSAEDESLLAGIVAGSERKLTNTPDPPDYQDEFVGDMDVELGGVRAGAPATESKPLCGTGKERKKAVRKQNVSLDRRQLLDSDGNPMLHANGSVKMRVRISGQLNVHKVVKVDDFTLGVAPDNGRDAVVWEFQQRMDLAGGYNLGKNHDGSYYKYANAMKLLFDYGPLVEGGPCFRTRSDFFQDWSKDLSDSTVIRLATSKGGDDDRKVKHHIRCLRHGFDTFVKLVHEQSSA